MREACFVFLPFLFFIFLFFSFFFSFPLPLLMFQFLLLSFSRSPLILLLLLHSLVVRERLRGRTGLGNLVQSAIWPVVDFVAEENGDRRGEGGGLEKREREMDNMSCDDDDDEVVMRPSG